MLQLKTIVAPVDFSERSAAAAEHAAVLARDFHSKLLYLHVLPLTPHEYLDMSTAAQQEQRRAAEAHRGEIERQIRAMADRDANGVEFEIVIIEGDPAHRIVRLAKEREADLIVMPTHGHGAFRRLLLGSTTAKALHDAPCPVLTGVHVEELPPFAEHPYRRIACALGLQELEHGKKALRWAWDLAQACQAGLVVAHTPPALHLAAAEWLPPDTAELMAQAGRETLERLLNETGVEAELRVGGRAPLAFVERTIAETGSDALVVGRSVSHGIFGGPRTDAMELIQASPVPVFSV